MNANILTDSISVDYIVFGAGIIGLTMADSLTEKGAEVLVFDINGIGSGASGTPIGLVDPAASRNARLYWDMEPCYQMILKNLYKIQSHTDAGLFHLTGILRPGINRSRALAYQKSFQDQEWPENWCEWKTESEIKSMCPGIRCEYGGLWHPNGITVALPDYLETYYKYLRKRGVLYDFSEKYELTPKINDWILDTTDTHYISQNIIFATGSDARFSGFWEELLIYPVKGQSAIFRTPAAIPFDFAVTGNGYIGHMASDTFIMGSTYEHQFEYNEPDEWGLNQLKKMLKQTLPDLYEKSKLIRQWSGIRASTPNRLPILGTHRFYKNVHIITGMGSKGLLYSKYTSDMLRDYLVEGIPIDPQVDIARIYQRLKKSSIID